MVKNFFLISNLNLTSFSLKLLFHNEQELEIDLEEEILEQFRKKISGSRC